MNLRPLPQSSPSPHCPTPPLQKPRIRSRAAVLVLTPRTLLALSTAADLHTPNVNVLLSTSNSPRLARRPGRGLGSRFYIKT